jgi:hypothetical protein
MGTGRRPTLSTKGADTSTWGKTLQIRAGLNDSLVGAPFGPYTPSPDRSQLLRLVDVRAPTAKPSTTSRDVTAYIYARQVYDNNKGITTNVPQRDFPQAITPLANRSSAFEALFGRLTVSRGGVSTFEEFVIPAHGVSLHIGSDTARLEVRFDPAKANIPLDGAADGFVRGKNAAGFIVTGGVATSGFYQDVIRQFYDLQLDAIGNNIQFFDVPRFARTLEVFTPTPQAYDVQWFPQESVNATALSNVPNNFASYVGAPQPIPVNAARLRVNLNAAIAAGEPSPVLVWSRIA